jgi:hypothetical protein
LYLTKIWLLHRFFDNAHCIPNQSPVKLKSPDTCEFNVCVPGIKEIKEKMWNGDDRYYYNFVISLIS